MEIEGVVFKVLEAVKGTSTRGEWTKQDVVVEMPGEFSRKVCVSFWGDKSQDAAALKEGESVSISVNVESKEYNGRWFTEVRAWKISKRGATQPSAAGVSTPPDFPPVSAEPYTNEEPDDLPF